MHYRFLVTFDKERAATSEEARAHVRETLLEEGFCSEGRWGGGMADWFVVGGRWSGELSRHSWARDITAEMEALEREHGIQVWGASYGDEDKERTQQELVARFQRLWDTHAPEAYQGIPFPRDTYQDNGYADDAMVLTQELYDGLLTEYEGQMESEYHTDLDYESVSPAMIGTKWLVVVDYHN
jgi:hypothetical protein